MSKNQLIIVYVLVYIKMKSKLDLPEYRAKGYSKQLMNAIVEEPKLQKCKTWMLKTHDAHGLYKHFGFAALKHSEKVMERIL